MQLLYHQSYISLFALLICIPYLEDTTEIINCRVTPLLIFCLALSGLLAFLVNLTTFIIINNTSPITYNVMGHFKTCLIIFWGLILFGRSGQDDKRSLIGFSIALGGIFWYSSIKLGSNGKQDVKLYYKRILKTNEIKSYVYRN